LKGGETSVDEAFPPVLTLDLVEASSAGRLKAAPRPASTIDVDPNWAPPTQAQQQPCGFDTPDGACNLPAGHATGPELDGFDGHDVVPQ
jgi:hypothetical protein